ncbi:hypothetical protein VMCG_03777 [Cytospora schulzeri]|uniref:Uncharacterized protein n=1 Tax=Cytospora schulzeri TaxID=448051 RepID=A0A423WVA5_9PEZI|nr:hypothetical protein VMCG_03777 [Valsa malicola]
MKNYRGHAAELDPATCRYELHEYDSNNYLYDSNVYRHGNEHGVDYHCYTATGHRDNGLDLHEPIFDDDKDSHDHSTIRGQSDSNVY